VINELDKLAQDGRQGTGQTYDSEDHAYKVRTRAQHTMSYLEREFDKKNSHLKALTSKGTVMETIAFRSEETDMTVSRSFIRRHILKCFIDNFYLNILSETSQQTLTNFTDH